jgi:hypothetical protein
VAIGHGDALGALLADIAGRLASRSEFDDIPHSAKPLFSLVGVSDGGESIRGEAFTMRANEELSGHAPAVPFPVQFAFVEHYAVVVGAIRLGLAITAFNHASMLMHGKNRANPYGAKA